MKTVITIEAEMTDEQCDVLLYELKNTAELIGIKLQIESSKLTQHDISNTTNVLGTKALDLKAPVVVGTKALHSYK